MSFQARFIAFVLSLATISGVLFLFPGTGLAQSDASVTATTLPELLDENSSAKVLNASNVSSYKSIVPPELLPLFKDGQLEIEAARSLKNAPRLHESWGKGKDAGLAGISGELKAGVKVGNGLLFDPASLNIESNQRILAYKLLWNSFAVWASSPLFASEFEFSWFKEGKPYRTLRGEFSRIVPNALAESRQTAQFFRELIRFTSPQFLKDLSWLTFRFSGADEDVLWVYSPAIRKVRQLTSTNRSDPLLRSALTPEEFLVWGGKPESVDAISEGNALMLAPVVRSDLGSRKMQEGCIGVDRAGAVANKLGSRWNYETSRFAHGAGWVPSTSVFLPRPLWRVAVNSLDPFSSYGRQTLYIDQALSLPVYKFVYNRMGQLWKTVIGAYGVAPAESAQGQIPYPAYTLVIDHQKSEVYVIDYAWSMFCSQPIRGFALVDFDPKRFTEEAGATTAQPAAPTAAPTPAEELDEL